MRPDQEVRSVFEVPHDPVATALGTDTAGIVLIPTAALKLKKPRRKSQGGRNKRADIRR
jgi:hypothetical protein